MRYRRLFIIIVIIIIIIIIIIMQGLGVLEYTGAADQCQWTVDG